MTGHLAYGANQARLDDLRRRAGAHGAVRHARAATFARDEIRINADEPVAIRRATEADRDALERLAALDSAQTPSGAVLIAEVDDEPQAAIEVTGGTVVADPFRPTAHVVELLRARAARLSEPAGSSRRLRLRWRSAYRAV
jgi:hypothetical protein